MSKEELEKIDLACAVELWKAFGAAICSIPTPKKQEEPEEVAQ